MDAQEIEDHIMAHQGGWIREHYGEEEASKANYGWGIDGVEGTVSTKVYGPGKIITTRFENGEYLDVVEDYR